jgi:hypothetical protein
MYQARSLIGSDASGLSDPYAQIIFCENSTKTQVLIYIYLEMYIEIYTYLYAIQSDHCAAQLRLLNCLLEFYYLTGN